MRLMFIVAICALLCGGCYEMNEDGTNAQVHFSSVCVHTVRGHDYVIVTVSGGVSVVHAASCSCMNGNDKKGGAR